MLKKDNAFTLVELLAVIIILGIILVLAIPRVTNMIDKYRDKAYDIQIDNMVTKAKEYSLSYSDKIEWDGSIAYIKIKDLQDYDLLPNPLKNPKGGTFDSNEIVLTLVKDENSLIKYYKGELILLASKIEVAEGVDFKNEETSNEAYFYEGPNPNNWIEFGKIDSIPILWRIIKSNDEGIKIIYEGKRKHDNTPPEDNGRIIKIDNGDEIYAVPWNSLGGEYGSNKWEYPATLKDILDDWYTNILVINPNHIAPIKWCIGASGITDIGYPFNPVPLAHFLETECIGGTYDNLSGETTETFQGRTNKVTGIGLIRPSDYISTSDAETCTGSFWRREYDIDSGGYDCGEIEGISTNFLYKDKKWCWWTLNARAESSSNVWHVSFSGYVGTDYASNSCSIRPVLNLKPNIFYDKGEGTLVNPYTVK